MLQKKKGFTLIELLITITILSISIAPIFSMFIRSSKDIEIERKYLQAMFLAHKTMEELLFGLSIHPKINIVSPKFKTPYEDFKCNIIKKRIEGDSELFKLTVIISFKAGFSSSKVKLESLYSSRFPLKIYHRKDNVWAISN